MTDQVKMQDPTTIYPTPPQEKQEQSAPGLSVKMSPKPDHGELSYKGSGKLTGRRALITGADSGIGRAVAIAFAREGADVALAYLPEEQPDADEVVTLVEEAGRNAVALPGDLKDEAYCERLVADTVAQLGGLDILVNVAGKQTSVADIADLTTDQFDATFKTNVYAMFWLTKAAVPHLRPGASIINTSSVQAYQPGGALLDYATTKASNNAFAKALAEQLGPKGIRVNVVAPGPIWTPLQITGGQPPEAIPDFGAQTALGRAGQPAELAGAYVYLASDDATYTTGSTISVTGGMPTP